MSDQEIIAILNIVVILQAIGGLWLVYRMHKDGNKITAQAELIRSLQEALAEAEERIAGLLRERG